MLAESATATPAELAASTAELRTTASVVAAEMLRLRTEMGTPRKKSPVCPPGVVKRLRPPFAPAAGA